MIKGFECKVYTFINCGRKVELPNEGSYHSIDSFIHAVNSQLALEKATPGKKAKANCETLRHCADVLKLIEKHHGTFFRWRRDIGLNILLIEVLFDDLNNMYGYGYEIYKIKNISSKYVYSTIFDGKCHVSTSVRKYKYPKLMSNVMIEAAENEEALDQKEFYYAISHFLDFIGTMEIHKIKLFKNRYGNLVVDVMFKRFNDFINFKKAMDDKYNSWSSNCK